MAERDRGIYTRRQMLDLAAGLALSPLVDSTDRLRTQSETITIDRAAFLLEHKQIALGTPVKLKKDTNSASMYAITIELDYRTAPNSTTVTFRDRPIPQITDEPKTKRMYQDEILEKYTDSSFSTPIGVSDGIAIFVDTTSPVSQAIANDFNNNVSTETTLSRLNFQVIEVHSTDGKVNTNQDYALQAISYDNGISQT